MKHDPNSGADAAQGVRALAQPIAAALSRAAIFLVMTVKPGAENRASLRSFCADLSALIRAVEFRDIEAGLSCVMGFGSEAWDRLFGAPRPAELHPFREIRLAGAARDGDSWRFVVSHSSEAHGFVLRAGDANHDEVGQMRFRRWMKCTAFDISTIAT